MYHIKMKKQEDKIMANNKVLIVDDDEHIVELIKLYMDKEGLIPLPQTTVKKPLNFLSQRHRLL